jgi:hypothetical protein
VAQGVGPEFKPQYQKKKKKITWLTLSGLAIPYAVPQGEGLILLPVKANFPP